MHLVAVSHSCGCKRENTQKSVFYWHSKTTGRDRRTGSALREHMGAGLAGFSKSIPAASRAYPLASNIVHPVGWGFRRSWFILGWSPSMAPVFSVETSAPSVDGFCGDVTTYRMTAAFRAGALLSAALASASCWATSRGSSNSVPQS